MNDVHGEAVQAMQCAYDEITRLRALLDPRILDAERAETWPSAADGQIVMYYHDGTTMASTGRLLRLMLENGMDRGSPIAWLPIPRIEIVP